MTAANEESIAGLTQPLKWPWALASPPILSSDRTTWQGALLRAWSGTSPVMVQPPLDHHYIVMHLGGAKHVTRRRDGPMLSSVAESGSITIVPAGTSYLWKTQGPIAFAHLYLHPRQLENIVDEQFGAEGRDATLIERIGCRDRLLEPLFVTMIDEIGSAPKPSRLLLDSMLESFVIRLAERHARAPRGLPARAVALAPHRLRRVLDFMDAHLGEDIALADLVAAAGTSQFHFSRAFHGATGFSPYRYLLRRRLDYARVLLLTTSEALETISGLCGFNSRHQFSLMFKRSVGIGPKRFRMARSTPSVTR
ncbi:MAG: AraC family transcriptional regulator [Caldimonas sp.]